MKYSRNLYLAIITAITGFSCNNDRQINEVSQTPPSDKMFVQRNPEYTGVQFSNFIKEDFMNNIFTFDYMYNGAGVAAGDVNNDGLPDLFFTGNMADNALYLNKGDLQFEDISRSSGIMAEDSWCNGVSVTDINQDGLIDFYVCRSSPSGNLDKMRNLLYVNNGDNTFTESAETYGIADEGYSVQSVFFDMDNDMDLDLFIANHPSDFKIPGRARYEYWLNPVAKESNKLYRNNGDGTFTDVTVQSGVLDFSFSLGVIAQDLDDDGFVDLFVSNDYDEPDHYYENNGDGTFTRMIDQKFRHISNFGMGVDAGDINGDGLTDLITVDMLAEDNYREKTQMGSMSPETFWMAVDWGFHYQYMRNSLHLNIGDGHFIEIGQMANIHRTDWSWAPLFADYDNDGHTDLYITNGFRRDSRDKDTRHHNDSVINARGSQMTPVEIEHLLSSIPSTKTRNYLFQNNGDYTFSDITSDAGMDIPSFSNGAIYSDLDMDGDLDLIVNNLLDKAFLFENQSNKINDFHYLKIGLIGMPPNRQGYGSKVTVYFNGNINHHEMNPSRGYLSSVDQTIHFGLGNSNIADSVLVRWPDGSYNLLKDVKADQTIKLNQISGVDEMRADYRSDRIFTDITGPSLLDNLIHSEVIFDDYEKQVLLPHKLSQQGPCLAVGDVNADNITDFFFGGASGQAGTLMIGKEHGFISSANRPWVSEKSQEDVVALFFDYDGDGDQDLFVGSGGNEAPNNVEYYQDRLYNNDGKGNFTRDIHALPYITTSTGAAAYADYDNDGDLDLFIGGRHTPWAYPTSPVSYLLENNNGKFTVITDRFPLLDRPGMITDAVWADLFDDGFPELILAGEWMPIIVLDNTEGQLGELLFKDDLSGSTGWWNCIVADDIDDDGDIDLIGGNLGLNYKYKASKVHPFHLYGADYDSNGIVDIVLAYENKVGKFPVRGRQCSSEQIPEIKKKFPTYKDFGSSDLEQIYGSELHSSDYHFMITDFSSSVFLNQDNKGFDRVALPSEAQFAPINSIVLMDANSDSIKDMIVAGNLHVSEVETGRADAGTGLLLLGTGSGNFQPIHFERSGLKANYDVRSMAGITSSKKKPIIIIGNNNGPVQAFELTNAEGISTKDETVSLTH